MTFCKHGVPNVGCGCRWCRDGNEPEVHVERTEEERAGGVAAIRADWDRQLAALPAKKARRARGSK